MKRSEQEYPNDLRAQKIFEHGFREGVKENKDILLRLIRLVEYIKQDYEVLSGERILNDNKIED